jgi:hypothetical protein
MTAREALALEGVRSAKLTWNSGHRLSELSRGTGWMVSSRRTGALDERSDVRRDSEAALAFSK